MHQRTDDGGGRRRGGARGAEGRGAREGRRSSSGILLALSLPPARARPHTPPPLAHHLWKPDDPFASLCLHARVPLCRATTTTTATRVPLCLTPKPRPLSAPKKPPHVPLTRATCPPRLRRPETRTSLERPADPSIGARATCREARATLRARARGAGEGRERSKRSLSLSRRRGEKEERRAPSRETRLRSPSHAPPSEHHGQRRDDPWVPGRRPDLRGAQPGRRPEARSGRRGGRHACDGRRC